MKKHCYPPERGTLYQGRRILLRAHAQTDYTFQKKLFRVPMRIFKGKIRYWSLPQIIMNYCIIMATKYYNFMTNPQCNYYISSRNAIKCGSNCGCYYFLFKKKNVKRSVQCHVFARSPPDRRPNDISSQHFAPLPICVNMFHCGVVW
jgi:hypothetical protein